MRTSSPPLKVVHMLEIESYAEYNSRTCPEVPEPKYAIKSLKSLIRDLEDQGQKSEAESILSEIENGDASEVLDWMKNAESNLEMLFHKILKAKRMIDESGDMLSSLDKPELLDLLEAVSIELEDDMPIYKSFEDMMYEISNPNTGRAFAKEFNFLNRKYFYYVDQDLWKLEYQMKSSPEKLTIALVYGTFLFQIGNDKMHLAGEGITFEPEQGSKLRLSIYDLKEQFPDWVTLDDDAVKMAKVFWPGFSYDILSKLNAENQFLSSIVDQSVNT